MLLLTELAWGTGTKEVHLKFKGDWGISNLTRACGWIATGMWWRTAKTSTFWIRNGRGYADNVLAVANGEVDVAITTPIATVVHAFQGKGLFSKAYPYLRTITVFPHRDRLVMAVTAETGLRSFAEIREKRFPLRLVTAPDDGINHAGFLAWRILERYDISRDELESWGGKVIELERPPKAPLLIQKGEANAIFYEAVIRWHPMMEQKAMRFLPFEDDLLSELESDGYRRAVIHAGEYAGIQEDVPVLDWSQWVLVAREDLPEDVAYLMAQVIVEDREDFEMLYRHIPRERSPVFYPIDPAAICRDTGIPLHAGAERYYREHGFLN